MPLRVALGDAPQVATTHSGGAVESAVEDPTARASRRRGPCVHRSGRTNVKALVGELRSASVREGSFSESDATSGAHSGKMGLPGSGRPAASVAKSAIPNRGPARRAARRLLAREVAEDAGDRPLALDEGDAVVDLMARLVVGLHGLGHLDALDPHGEALHDHVGVDAALLGPGAGVRDGIDLDRPVRGSGVRRRMDGHRDGPGGGLVQLGGGEVRRDAGGQAVDREPDAAVRGGVARDHDGEGRVPTRAPPRPAGCPRRPQARSGARSPAVAAAGVAGVAAGRPPRRRRRSGRGG